MPPFSNPAKYIPSTRILDITGERYGRLSVIAFSHRDNKGSWFKCLCDCGATAYVTSHNLRSHTKSCGCLLKDILIARNTTHGKTSTKAYRIWQGMLNRCYNANYAPYPDYGGRGITVDLAWHTFEQFYRDMGDPPEGMTIERRDNNGGYSKGNCRWATARDQAGNRRSNRMVSFNGKMQCVAAWERELGFKAGTLKARLRQRWPLEEAMIPPAERKSKTSSSAA